MPYESQLGVEAASGRFARQPAPHAVLAVRGRDAEAFLQQLCSQDVTAIGAGACAPAAFLNSKGKLLATVVIGRGAGGFWLESPRDGVAALADHLERYHFAEQLEIVRHEGLVCAELLGEGALEAAGLAAGSCQEPAAGVVVLAGAPGGLESVRHHGPAESLASPRWDAPPLDGELAEAMRICAGIARVGLDTDETTLGLEAGLDDHVSTTKGCYTGQEIVARIHTYGHVNRKLCRLEIADPEAFERGTTLVEIEDGDPVGRAMSSAPLPDGGRRVALGYLPRDFWPAGTELRLGSLDGPVARVF